MTTISSPYSNTVRFLPISPSPPRGRIAQHLRRLDGSRAPRLIRTAPSGRPVDRRSRRRSRSTAAVSERPGRRGRAPHRRIAGRRRRSRAGGGWPLAVAPPRARSQRIGDAQHVQLHRLLERRPGGTRPRGGTSRRPSASRAPVAGSTGRIVPCAWPMRAPGRNVCIEKRPSVTTSAGSSTSSCRRSQGAQAAISSGSGSRLPGGRHLTTLVMKTSSTRPADRRPAARRGSRPRRPRRASLQVLVLAGPLAHEDDLRVRVPLPGHGVACGRRRSRQRCSRGSSAAIVSSAAPPLVRRHAARPARRDAGASQPRASDELGDLDGVRGGALAQVVRDHPEREPAAVVARDVLADAPDEDLVACPAASVASG